MFVKICGLTNREDALAAVEYGARALGFVFYPRSPRRADPDTLAKWIGEIPPDVWKAGVFVDESPENIEQISRHLNLDIAQLHGAETPGQYPAGLRIWKAIRVTGPELAIPENSAEALLLDGPGSGRPFDWTLCGQALPHASPNLSSSPEA